MKKLNLLLMAVWWCATLTAQQTSAPGLNERVTQNNLFQLLDKYDPDAAFILREVRAHDKNLLSYYSSGDKLLDELNTTVHEFTHSYHFYSSIWGGQRINLGNGRFVDMVQDKVHKSEEMAARIPSELRTFRFKTYVERGVGVSSNVNGIFGLLNEFAAYYQGTHVIAALKDYLLENNAGWDTWHEYLSSYYNGSQAYLEFKFYILRYLQYAERNYPDDYRTIMANETFWLALREKDRQYTALLNSYYAAIERLAEEKGWKIDRESGFIRNQNRSGVGLMADDYKKLKLELEKNEYQQLISRYGLSALPKN